MTWITGKELADPPYNLRDFELLNLVKQGLQPYSPVTGEPIICPKRFHEAWHLRRQLTNMRREDPRTSLMIERFQEIKNTDPRRQSWKHFQFPVSEHIAERFLQNGIYPMLRDALFLREDISPKEEVLSEKKSSLSHTEKAVRTIKSKYFHERKIFEDFAKRYIKGKEPLPTKADTIRAAREKRPQTFADVSDKRMREWLQEIYKLAVIACLRH